MADRITPEEVARLRALIAEQAAEIARLRRWHEAVTGAAYEAVKMYDNGPECWPEWFEGYGLDALCAAMYPKEDSP